MINKFLNQSFIAFAIRQGGIEHDRIKFLSVVDVVNGQINEIYEYDTNPENLSDVWVDLIDCFKQREYAVAYNLAIHRSNLEKSLEAVGVTPPSIKYVCAMNWANTIGDLESFTSIPPYDGSKSLVDMIAKISTLSGMTIAERYDQIHISGRTSTSNYFRQLGNNNADLNGLVWLDTSEVDESFWQAKTVVITGDFSTYPDRALLSEIIMNKGGKTSSAISGKTNIVLVGNGAGPSKLNKIRELVNSGKEIVCVNEELLNQII